MLKIVTVGTTLIALLLLATTFAAEKKAADGVKPATDRDSSGWSDETYARRIAVERAAAVVMAAEEDLVLQKAQNDYEIAAATGRAELATLDLEKFESGEAVHELNMLKGELSLAQQDLARAGEPLNATRPDTAKASAADTTVETDRANLSKAQIRADLVKEKLKLVEDYEHRRKQAALKIAAGDLHRARQLATLQAQLNVVRLQRELDIARLELENARKRLDELKKPVGVR